ncbi:Hypothetical Protein FCC1311_002892 [Hondaea fermentalgiana]|uniref:Uncharacterized protein n=1 Tax=Hondaea fermentalgiana TaxID=2315210 RepID=A0A2R5G7R0_9STRA|nr:Hypothetical Protein FCC1311_002892 [Hondaea fermentalgiana]|eukprot:GBG24071.1 Hypothetical Protein FCC1311_002892 [Hondaea fermentalgiana]
MRREDDFQDALSASVREAPWEAVFFETRPTSSTTAAEDVFEFVLVPSRGLQTVATADLETFAEQLAAAESAGRATAVFTNLGGDATLVVPTIPAALADAQDAFRHVGPYFRATKTLPGSTRALWQSIAESMTERMSQRGARPVWLSTSGLGVYYLHFRLDDRPKYYTTIVPAQDTHHDGAEHEQMPQQACLRWETRARMLHGLQVKVPDTVLFEAGEPVRWLFTSQQTGVVLAKKRSRLNETDILRAFGRSAKGGFVAVARSRVPGRKRLRIEFLRSYQVLDLLRDTKQLRCLESLQVCAGMHAERGFSAYEVSYVAGSRTSVWRVTDDMRVMGVKSGRSAAYEAALERYRSGDSRRREVYRKQDEIRVVSQAKTSNEVLVDAAQMLVRALEKRLGRGRVATLTAEFIETRDAGLILTHVAELTLADGPVTDVSLLSQLGLGVDDNGSLSSGRSSDHASVASGLAEETATTSKRYEEGKRGYKGRSAKASMAFELQTGETPEKMRRAVVSKSHRVEKLQQMLSSAVSHAQGWHPPLIAIRRKSFIPATPSK